MPTIKANGVNLYYEIHGQGAPLVLINGLNTELTEYEPIVRPLAQRFRVLTFDNRGAGRSDKPDIPYSIEVMADDTAALMRAVGFEQANIIGISMGGRIALALALNYPQLVKRLVLASTSARGRGHRGWIVGLADRLPNLSRVHGQYPQPRYARNRQRRAVAAFDCSRRLGELHVPTLIMHGTKDHLTPYRLAQEMNAGIVGSSLISVPGGHFYLFVAGRKQFLDAVTAFLET